MLACFGLITAITQYTRSNAQKKFSMQHSRVCIQRLGAGLCDPWCCNVQVPRSDFLGEDCSCAKRRAGESLCLRSYPPWHVSNIVCFELSQHLPHCGVDWRLPTKKRIDNNLAKEARDCEIRTMKELRELALAIKIPKLTWTSRVYTTCRFCGFFHTELAL